MAVLELTNISKNFGAIQAVNDVSLEMGRGEVVGLMGDNGAGKSTLVKMIAGNFLPSSGTMRIDGREVVLHRPVEARRSGIEIAMPHAREAQWTRPAGHLSDRSVPTAPATCQWPRRSTTASSRSRLIMRPRFISMGCSIIRRTDPARPFN